MESLLPLVLFAFISSITPGPNNIMLTSSGLRFGFARTVPHLLGVCVGFSLLLALAALGLGSVLLALPAAQSVLKVAGSGYLLYLAWQLRSMAFSDDVAAQGRPMSFVSALAFQFANPKAWVMAITGVSAFMPALQPLALAVGVFCLVFSMVNLPCVSLWAIAGASLRRHLRQPHWQRLFCGAMVLATVYSALAIWL